MARYVMLLNWTDQGIRAVKDTVKRSVVARQTFEKAGAKLVDFYWTSGSHDMVLVAEAPDDEAISRVGLQLGMLGNVRSTTMRAYNEKEMEQIVKSL